MDVLGGVANMAEALEATPQRVSNWRCRGVPLELCPTIERLTSELGFPVYCDDLRAEVQWARIADPMWPHHPSGRPVLDLSKAVQPKATV